MEFEKDSFLVLIDLFILVMKLSFGRGCEKIAKIIHHKMITFSSSETESASLLKEMGSALSSLEHEDRSKHLPIGLWHRFCFWP